MKTDPSSQSSIWGVVAEWTTTTLTTNFGVKENLQTTAQKNQKLKIVHSLWTVTVLPATYINTDLISLLTNMV